MKNDGRKKNGGARKGSGPKKKDGHILVMVSVPMAVFKNTTKEIVRNFAENAVSSNFLK